MNKKKTLLAYLCLGMTFTVGCVGVGSGEQKEKARICVDQIGYLSDQAKKAVFMNGKEGQAFNVVNTKTNEVVYSGTLEKPLYSKGAGSWAAVGDFTNITEPGFYRITSKNIADSYEFRVGDDIYRDVFESAVKFFYYQRCGSELTKEYAGEWTHPTCHAEMAKIYGTEKKIDVSGGWHDAGDYGRYVVPTSKAVADLMLAYQYNQDAFSDKLGIPESGNGIPDVLDEVRYALEWLLKMQDKECGGVYHKVTCADFPGFVMPQEEKNELIVCPISTTATGDFTAVMAMASQVYKEIDPDFAQACLEASLKAWEYLEQTPYSTVDNPEGIVTGAYEDTEDYDERIWASAELYIATGDKKYHELLVQVTEGMDKCTKQSICYGWQNISEYAMNAYVSYKQGDSIMVESLKGLEKTYTDVLRDTASRDPYGITAPVGNDIWGSNMYYLSNAIALDEQYRYDTSDIETRNQAIEMVHYCFGKNPINISYVTGFGSVYPKHPHHRPSIATQKTISGMLVGGANQYLEDDVIKEAINGESPARCYIDNFESYSTNEVAIYWNSALVYALARLELV